jgi:3-deoxy-manno-octulosonate cytidylyltransferase (CMP-KDO synthetase)
MRNYDNFKILDCTLRDGGYYTNWEFDSKLVKQLVKTLNNKVDIIELGYKSPVKGGPYRKCNDGFIKSILDFEYNVDLAFMIDVKDYIHDFKVNKDLVKDIIKPSSSSPFKICRIAAKYSELGYLPKLIDIIRNLGYEVYCNLMAITTLNREEINEFFKILDETKVEIGYIADSYGALLPSQVKILSDNLNYPLSGIHTHDNLGLAFANCLQAIDLGVEYIDGTILGMGRGVGNVKTEQLIMWKSIPTSDLWDLVSQFQKLKNKYNWGFNNLYMVAGMNHIHPLYVQDLTNSNLTNPELIETLKELKGNTNYNSNLLDKPKEQRAVVVIPARYKSSRFPGKPLAKIKGKEMILHVAKKAEQAVGKENVYIATENQEIALLVRKNGYNVILTSDSCLTGTDRVAEASKEIDADIFINLQGDEPMIDPNDILRVIEAKKDNPKHVINCMSSLHKDEDQNDKKIPKIICDLNNNLLYSSRNPIPGRKDGDGKNIMKQVCIYAFNKSHLEDYYSENKTPLESQEDIEIIRFLEKGVPVKMIEIDKVSYAVDYPEDIKIIENII